MGRRIANMYVFLLQKVSLVCFYIYFLCFFSFSEKSLMESVVDFFSDVVPQVIHY